jgi:hypothetical protein
MIKCKVHYLTAGGLTRKLQIYTSFHIFHSIKGKGKHKQAPRPSDLWGVYSKCVFNLGTK